MTTKLASTEVDYDPICPHCEDKFAEVHWRRGLVRNYSTRAAAGSLLVRVIDMPW